ncbi:hypothetical protein AGIG_G9740 [Arapaima gigas]
MSLLGFSSTPSDKGRPTSYSEPEAHQPAVLTGPPQPTASCFPSWSSLCITRQVRGLGVPTMPELQLASPLHCPCESPSSLP